MVYLFGAGGHAKVITEILQDSNKLISAFIDGNPALTAFWDYPVYRELPDTFDRSADEVIIAIGNNAVRKRIVENLDVNYTTAIHPKATISKRATIGEGSVVIGNALINADTKVGRHCIINSSASVDHDCTIHDFVHISPNASLCGNVTIGEASHIGAGATIIPGITIGKNVVIGAGAVVIRDIPDNAIAVGNPAKVIRHI
ncbi:MAG: acetyltransferase [Filimonas sp.]|nr:acetyltransferase [Filimonas sp.]